MPRPTLSALQQDARRDLVAVTAALLALVMVGTTVSLGPGYAARALLWFAVSASVMWHRLRGGTHPHTRFGIANRITLIRLALGSMLAGLLGGAVPAGTPLAWSIVALAALTALLDAVDGAMARRSGLSSAFGARFDMETDAAYTLVLSALVWQAGQAGPWVLAAGLLRYAFVAAAWAWPWLAAPLPPSRRRQTLCAVQVATLVVCLAPIVPPSLSAALAATSLALLGLSFALDVRWLAQQRGC